MLYIILNLVELFDEAFDMEVSELGHEFAREQFGAYGEDIEDFDFQAVKARVISLATDVTFDTHYYASHVVEGGFAKFPFFLMILDRGGKWM